jgi:gas vesicle protein
MFGVLLGAIAATLVVLFRTPLSGRETREQLAARIAGLRGDGDTEA